MHGSEIISGLISEQLDFITSLWTSQAHQFLQISSVYPQPFAVPHEDIKFCMIQYY